MTDHDPTKQGHRLLRRRWWLALIDFSEQLTGFGDSGTHPREELSLSFYEVAAVFLDFAAERDGKLPCAYVIHLGEVGAGLPGAFEHIIAFLDVGVLRRERQGEICSFALRFVFVEVLEAILSERLCLARG